jgi:hypothetical protein
VACKHQWTPGSRRSQNDEESKATGDVLRCRRTNLLSMSRKYRLLHSFSQTLRLVSQPSYAAAPCCAMSPSSWQKSGGGGVTVSKKARQ